MRELSPLEKNIYEYIKKTISETGYSPSVRDIKNELMIKSTSTVHLYLKRLEESGYISKEDGKSRTIRIDCDVKDLKNKIPLLGDVRDGSPLNADENFGGYVDFAVPKGYFREDLFAIRLNDSALPSAGIRSGDTVIISKSATLKIGDITVNAQDGTIKLKAFEDNSNSKKATILGKVIAVLRFY